LVNIVVACPPRRVTHLYGKPFGNSSSLRYLGIAKFLFFQLPVDVCVLSEEYNDPKKSDIEKSDIRHCFK
jgi:hypothetical protein